MTTETFSTAKMRELLGVQQNPCVSIYLPTHPSGTEVREDPIRYRNLLHQSEKRLSERGFGGEKASRMLQPGFDLLNTPVLWGPARPGLAVFLSPNVFHAYTLPLECPEQAHVGNHFYIKPLIPLYGREEAFWILALSQGQVRLYEASPWDLVERPLPDAPRSLKDFTKYDEVEESVQCRSMPQAMFVAGSGVFHGQGSAADKAQRKRMIVEYVKAVRKAVERQLAADSRPLVLVGAQFVQSVYREASRYPHLMADGVTHGLDHFDEKQIHQAAWAIARIHFLRPIYDRLAQYDNLLGTGQASDQVEEIVPAAKEGRIDTLFIDLRSPAWGTLENGRVVIHSGPTNGDEDLLDLAAGWTLSHSGRVYALEPDQRATRGPAGAVFRY